MPGQAAGEERLPEGLPLNWEDAVQGFIDDKEGTASDVEKEQAIALLQDLYAVDSSDEISRTGLSADHLRMLGIFTGVSIVNQVKLRNSDPESPDHWVPDPRWYAFDYRDIMGAIGNLTMDGVSIPFRGLQTPETLGQALDFATYRADYRHPLK